MNITEHEMKGLLTGKCIPGDMRVNEELSWYLVRKFESLHEELKFTSAAANRGRDRRIELEAERDALQQQVNALAAEGVCMDKFVNDCLQVAWVAGSLEGSEVQELALKNGLLRKESYCAGLHENMTDDPGNFVDGDDFFIRVETPATNEIQNEWMAKGLMEAIKVIPMTMSMAGKLNDLAYELRTGDKS